MSENVREITDDEFPQIIKEKLTLVDFWAPWCGPCLKMTPILEEVAQAIGATAQICKINVDEHQQYAAEFGVQSIPALMIFKDGALVNKFVGTQSKNTLIDALKKIK